MERTVTVRNTELTVTANVWKNHGKERVYFDMNGARACYDLVSGEFIAVKGRVGAAQEAAIEKVFADVLGIEVEAEPTTEEEVETVAPENTIITTNEDSSGLVTWQPGIEENFDYLGNNLMSAIGYVPGTEYEIEAEAAAKLTIRATPDGHKLELEY